MRRWCNAPWCGRESAVSTEAGATGSRTSRSRIARAEGLLARPCGLTVERGVRPCRRRQARQACAADRPCTASALFLAAPPTPQASPALNTASQTISSAPGRPAPAATLAGDVAALRCPARLRHALPTVHGSRAHRARRRPAPPTRPAILPHRANTPSSRGHSRLARRASPLPMLASRLENPAQYPPVTLPNLRSESVYKAAVSLFLNPTPPVALAT